MTGSKFRLQLEPNMRSSPGEKFAEPIRTPPNQCKISFQIHEFHGIVAFELPQIALSCTTHGQNSDLLRPIQPLNAHRDQAMQLWLLTFG